MGKNRQQMKEKIDQDLRDKIEGTKKILTALEAAFADVQKNSVKVQGDVQASFEDMYQVLLARKLKLIGQIEELSLAQAVSLQESIQQAYLELGSMQSTLFHIDSFDLGQLTNVNVQDRGRINYNVVHHPVKTELDSKVLKDEISKWGSTFVDVTSSAISNSSIIKEACEKVVKVSPQPKIGPATTKKNLNALDFDVDEWLRGIKAQTCNESEDFEMLLMDSDSVENKIDETEKLSSRSPSDANKVNIVVEVDDQDKSSIVCMDSDEGIVEFDFSKWLQPKKAKTVETCTESDLSKWLKPKNTNDLSSISPPLVALVPPEVIQQNSRENNKTPYIDFPCLRLDPKCWLHKKVPKENWSYNLRADFNFGLSEKQIIPPTYALPYPFWLKKF